MRRAGHYYEPAQFLFHKLWRNEFLQMGFRVICIEKIQYHPVWFIRLRGTASAQNYLLLNRPLAKPIKADDDRTDLMLLQLKAEIRRIASLLGPQVKSDDILMLREGGVFFSFIHLEAR